VVFSHSQQVVDLEVEVLAEVLVASEVAEVSAEVALLADGRKKCPKLNFWELSLRRTNHYQTIFKQHQIISNNTKVKKQPKNFRLLFF
jgi:hypothetical protein